MQYRAIKLCAYRHNSGASVIAPPGHIFEIEEKDAEALLELGAITPHSEDHAPAEHEDTYDAGNLSPEQFATWLASGAGAREVVAWIGEDAGRAEIAKVDERPSVQKRVSDLLDAGDDEDAVEADGGDEEE